MVPKSKAFSNDEDCRGCGYGRGEALMTVVMVVICGDSIGGGL